MWFVGADWDKKKCVVEARRGSECRKGKVYRTPEDVAAFIATLRRAEPSVEIVVGIESGDRLWPRLWGEAGAVVFVFDAAKAKNFANTFVSSKASSDPASAHSLCLQVMSEPHRRTANPCCSGELVGSQLLLSGLADLEKSISACRNRLWALLHQYHPALLPMLGKMDQVWVRKLLSATPTPAAWLEMSDEDRQRVVQAIPKKHRDRATVLLGTMYCELNSIEEAATRALIRAQVAQMTTLLGSQRSLNKALHEAMAAQSVYATARAIKGLGAQLGAGAAVILKSAPDHRDQAATASGCAPVTNRSGTKGQRYPQVKMRRSAAKVNRRAAYLIASQLVLRHAWAKAQFAYYTQRGIKAAAAYRRVARSFFRILRALHRDGTEFDQERYIRTLAAKGVTWAQDLAKQQLLTAAA